MKDIHIRQELKKNHLSVFTYDSDAIIVPEMGLEQGSIKIDIAVVNGSFIGYEIKSEQDTLDRLPAQMEAYNKVFDYINIVVNDKHTKKVKAMVPKFWGIIEVKKFDKDFKLVVDRLPKKNPLSDSFYIAQLLWKEEALDVLRLKGLDKGMKSKTRIEIWRKLSESVPKDEVNEFARLYLKKRTEWR